MSDIDINQLIQDTYSAKLQDQNVGGITNQLRLSKIPIFIRGDNEYLLMAINHLWDNALRHSTQGDTIIIHTEVQDNSAIIKITDTGVGIAEDDLDRIFERFYRLDKAGSTRGFGLGLPIAKAVVESLDGNITVESELGKGTTFQIKLPLSEDH